MDIDDYIHQFYALSPSKVNAVIKIDHECNHKITPSLTLLHTLTYTNDHPIFCCLLHHQMSLKQCDAKKEVHADITRLIKSPVIFIFTRLVFSIMSQDLLIGCKGILLI